MTTATITRTETYHLNLDSDTWPEGMTDQEKLTGWLFAARIEPEVAFKCLEADSVKIEGRIDNE